MAHAALISLLQTKTSVESIRSSQRVPLSPDLVVLTDSDAALVLEQLAKQNTNSISCDAVWLAVKPNSELKKQAEGLGITCFSCIDPLATLIDTGLVLPGELAISNMAEVSGVGGVGAVGLRCTVFDLADALQGQPIDIRIPNVALAVLSEGFPAGCGELDLFLNLQAKVMQVSAALEISGKGLSIFTVRQRVRLASWAGIAGGGSLFCVPDRTIVQELNMSAGRSFKTFEPAKDASYTSVHKTDLRMIRQQLITPDGQILSPVEVSNHQPSAVVIGGMMTCGVSELKRIRDVFRNHRPKLPVTVMPDSQTVFDDTGKEDILDHLKMFGVRVSRNIVELSPNTVITGVSGKLCYKAGLETAVQIAVDGVFGPNGSADNYARDSKLSGRLPKIKD